MNIAHIIEIAHITIFTSAPTISVSNHWVIIIYKIRVLSSYRECVKLKVTAILILHNLNGMISVIKVVYWI